MPERAVSRLQACEPSSRGQEARLKRKSVYKEPRRATDEESEAQAPGLGCWMHIAQHRHLIVEPTRRPALLCSLVDGCSHLCLIIDASYEAAAIDHVCRSCKLGAAPSEVRSQRRRRPTVPNADKLKADGRPPGRTVHHGQQVRLQDAEGAAALGRRRRYGSTLLPLPISQALANAFDEPNLLASLRSPQAPANTFTLQLRASAWPPNCTSKLAC